jgi:RpiB/LacA/LacB family sugar-phosphate isomerase
MLDCGLDWLGALGRVRPHAVVVTHAHPDHAAGLREGAPCPVHATEEAWHGMRRYPIDDRELIQPGRRFSIRSLGLEAFPLEHSLLAPAVGFRLAAGRVAIFYAPDVVAIAERSQALTGIDMYVGDGASVTRAIVRRRGDALIGHAPIREQRLVRRGRRAAGRLHALRVADPPRRAAGREAGRGAWARTRDRRCDRPRRDGARSSGKLETDVKIVLGADDEGRVADAVVDELRSRGHDVTVLEREQWPDVARKVAETVASGDADQGVLFCWTGTGTSMAANKVPGVRAALVWNPWIAEGARRWNDANVLVMSLKQTTPEQARDILDAWLAVDEPDPDEAANIGRLAELDRARRDA